MLIYYITLCNNMICRYDVQSWLIICKIYFFKVITVLCSWCHDQNILGSRHCEDLDHKHHIKLRMNYGDQFEDPDGPQKIKLLFNLHHHKDYSEPCLICQAKHVTGSSSGKIG